MKDMKDVSKKIEELLVQAGKTKKDLILFWQKEGSVNLDTLCRNKKPGCLAYKPITQVSLVRPGMFYHKDGNISEEYVGKDIIAIIIMVNHEKETAIALSVKGKELPFSSCMKTVNTVGLDGAKATEMLYKSSFEQNFDIEAIQYCKEFSCLGVEEGEAFLISEQEALETSEYMYNIKNACEKAGIPSCFMWTSTCINETYARVCALGSPHISIEAVTNSLPVHPAFELDLRHIL